MKKIIGLILVFCFLFAAAANAFAAGKPKIVKQPENGTTDKKGKVTFSVKTSGTVSSYTWYFVDPETNTSYSGKKLSSEVKGVKVVGKTNGDKITLKNVPESMHGWLVYVHINGNGYKIDSDPVYLLVYGMEPPEGAAPAASEDGSDTEDGNEASSDSQDTAEPESSEPAPDETTADDGNPGEETSGEPDPEQAAADTVPAEDEEVAPDTFTVTATSKVLRALDNSGNPIDDKPSSQLEFTGVGSFLVASDTSIVSWSINGVRIQPAEPVKEFRILNVSSNLSLDIKTEQIAPESIEVDESNMCKVTCTGCTFTYIRGKLRSVEQGEVPAGAQINVTANTSDLAAGGYIVNGAEPENQGKAGFQLVVTEDVEIICK